MRISFIVPGTPVPKARARVVRRAGQRPVGITPDRTKDYEIYVRVHALAARQRMASWPCAARYSVQIEVRRAERRGDLDNYCKAALDACNGILWNDDRQVDEIHVRRVAPGDVGEGLMVTVSTVE